MAALQDRRAPAVEDAVAVAPADRREAGVEVVRRRFGGQDRDGERLQVEVRAVAERLDWPVARQVEMRDLPGGVDAGVRPPGAEDARGLAGEALQRRFERFLDG